MKYFIVLLICISSLAEGQQIEALKMEKLDIPGGASFYHPAFDHSGTKLLLTTANYKGLTLFDLELKTARKISDADGAGYSPAFSQNNQTVLYVEQEFINNRRYSKLQAWNLNSGETKLLEPATRNLSVPMIAGNRTLYRADDQLKSAVINDSKPDVSDHIFAGIENQQLVLYRGDERLVITPYESESYIWPSVSPDRKHVLAYAMGKGAFICDLTGMVLAEPGQIEAPVWLGNEFIVGMVTKDDGHQILESEIVAVEPLTGQQKVLTPKGVVALNPAVSAETRKIAFHTLDGEIFIIHYQINW
jgi:hypothetical protein